MENENKVITNEEIQNGEVHYVKLEQARETDEEKNITKKSNPDDNSVTNGQEGSGDEKTTISKTVDSVSNFLGMCMGVILVIMMIYWIYTNYQENLFYKDVYAMAEKSIQDDLTAATNINFEDFYKEQISQAPYEMHDFGDGSLRYAVYYVTVPTEYDAMMGHFEIEPTVRVYYYTSDQGVSEGIDTSVENHFYAFGMFEDMQNAFDDLDVQYDSIQ